MSSFFSRDSLRRAKVFLLPWLILTNPPISHGEELPSADAEELTVVGRREKEHPFRTGQSELNLTGDELRLKISNTLGETLANQPGVHNASFGPGVGLPVLRGMSGVRVRVLEDGIGTWDASSVSPDHAITIEPVLAERIRVLQGPSTIQYGTPAVGGLVAVDTQRIPKTLTGRPVSGSTELRQELVNDHEQTTVAGKLNGELGNLAVHLDGFYREHDDVSIPGCAIDTEKVNEQFGFDAAESNTCGYVANSDADAHGFAAGSSYIGDGWHVGGSVRRFDYEYGIPPGSHTGHSHQNDSSGEDFVRLDPEQWRYDFSAGIDFNIDYLNSLDFLIARTDYEHSESEGGFVSTEFSNEVIEGKLQLDHSLTANSDGTVGAHYIDRDFEASGEEDLISSGSEIFVPKSDIDSYGLFILEQLQLASWTLQAGGRFDHTRLEQLEPTAPLPLDGRRLIYSPIRYDTYSANISTEYELNEAHIFGLALGRHQRAPDIVELLALGPHLATRSYDVGLLIRDGDPLPDAELFYSAEFSWGWQHRLGKTDLRLFYSDVEDFIYQANTGLFYDQAELSWRNNCVRLNECLPIYEYSQSDATFTGFELLWSLPAWEFGGVSWQWDLFADYVDGELDDPAHFAGGTNTLEADSDAIPRLPPWRIGSRMEWSRQLWLAGIDAVYVAEQDDPGAYETETDSYYRLDADLSYSLPARAGDILIFLRAKNITDEEIRNATSFMRNFAPEPGQSLELGFRMDF